MKYILFLITILFNFLVYSQDTLILDSLFISSGNTISGNYSYNNNSPIFNINYSGENSLSNRNLKFSTSTVYSVQYNIKNIANELQQKTNVTWKNIFLLHVFNHSLIRKIDTDNSIGLGFGKWWKYSSISYALLFQNTNYSTDIESNIFRHSIRLKLKYDMKRFGINYEYYYQPNIKSIGDNIIYGNIKLSVFINKKISVTLTDIINYRSISSVKLIHNLILGIGFNFKNT